MTRFLFLAALLAGCPVENKDDTGGGLPDRPKDDTGDTDHTGGGGDDTADEVDADLDGFTLADDCDDTDPTVNPGATEICDGLDNDCDTTVDEDAADAATWYTDADADGYGDAAAPFLSCSKPDTGVADATDCDDAAVAVNPAAIELCDEIDNDCDTTIDEDDAADAPTWYADADGDGYGDAAVPSVACGAPTGTVGDDTDCDDTSAAISPSAIELCDGIDDDCDGSVDEDDAADAPTWYADTDEDGYGDPAAGAPACTLPAGSVADATDCDDDDASVSPAGTDSCYDSVDQDCNGTVDDGCRAYTEHCGNITADETWDGALVHVVTCDVLVGGGAAPVLTIEDGALVLFGAGDRLAIGSANYGSLVVEGSSTGVTFTSEQDTPAAGDWDGIYVGEYNRGVSIVGATIEYAGGNGKGNVHADASYTASGALRIESSLIQYGSAAGIYLDDESELELLDSTVSDNVGTGVYLDTPSTLASTDGPTFTDNVITANGGYPVVSPVTELAQLDATSAFTGNGTDVIYVHSGTVTADGTWQALDVPYHFAGDVGVAGSAAPVLTISDGTVLEFSAGTGLSVGSTTWGGLLVEGTTTGVTFTSADATPAPGDWDGLYLGSYARAVTIDGATVEYGGGNGYGDIRVYYSDRYSETPVITDSILRYSSNSGLWVGDDSTVSVTGTEISDNADYGVSVQSDSALGTFTDNVLTGNTLGPISVPANYVGALDTTSTFAGNTLDYVYVTTDVVDSDATWSALDVDYRIAGEVYVEGASGPVLTIADGATLEFTTGISLRSGYRTFGALDVQGTTLGVTFTSAEPSPGPGDWGGIWIGDADTGSSLDGATILYAGGTGHGSVYLNDNAGSSTGAVITDSLIADGADSGLTLISGARVDVSGTTISDHVEYGCYVDENSTLSRSDAATFTDNVVTGNGYEPIYLSGDHAYALDDSSTYAGNGTDRIYVAGDTIDGDTTWQALDVPWYLAGDVTVQASTGPRLTLDPGTTVTFGRGAGLLIASSNYGSLYAVGTSADPITFTSGQATPAAGDWNGITIGTRDNGSTLQYTTVEYGGANTKGNVYFYSASSLSVVADSTIAYSSSWGIYRTSTTPTISGITYVGNASGELY